MIPDDADYNRISSASYLLNTDAGELQSALLLFSVVAAMAIRHRLSAYLLALAISVVPVAYAHGHHADLTDEERNAPIDAILWIHMLLQCAVWGILFPLGMVLGMSRSRWHVPLQVRSTIINIIIYYAFYVYAPCLGLTLGPCICLLECWLCIDYRGIFPRTFP